MLRKILVPLDGSKLGELALRYAAEMAVATKSEIHLVSVCDREDEEFRNMCSAYIEKVREEMATSWRGKISVSKIRTVIIDGQPDARILDYAPENNIGLIILVSHGHSGIMPWATGSTASHIIHKSDIPILLIRASDDAAAKQKPDLFKKILLPLDGSATSEAVLPYVKEIAAHMKSKIILLRVLERGQHVRTIGGLDYFAYTDQQVEDMKQEDTTYLNKIGQEFVNGGFSVKTLVIKGDVAQAIVDTAIKEKVSLIAMSSHGKSAAIEWVLGSVSHKIIQAGGKNLLLVRPPEKP